MRQIYRELNISLITCTLVLSQTALAKIYSKGNASDVTVTTQPILCLAGGASDDLWVDGWKHLLNASGGGDVVIIRPDSGRGTYESWIFDDSGNHGLPKVDSVTTIPLVKAADALSPEAATAVRNAELIFFDGGDQSIYLAMIEGTPLETALDYALHVRRVPMGGTSAGMALLGGIDFTAKYNPSKKSSLVTSELAMKDPTAQYVDLDRQTLVPPFMEHVIPDTHFSQRNRQGRLVSFMARAVYNNYGDVNPFNIKGIGADEGTAFCYNTNTGLGKVYGTNSVHFAIGNANIERITAGFSLSWLWQRQAVKVYSIPASANASASFDLSTWSGIGGIAEYWYVDGTDEANPIFGQN